MLFNSIEFAIFLPIVFFIYWFFVSKNLKSQNLFIILASYVFYGWWDWRFLSLIFISTVQDYYCAQRIHSHTDQSKRRLWLSISIFINIGILGFFKYYNFFAENFVTAFKFFGYQPSMASLNIILPVGISFYTFQTMSYTIDVYKKKIDPTNDFIAFAGFVSFFPLLVAGPIERATNLLPQFFKNRTFKYSEAVDGMRQILWGLFKKIVIADNCAEYVNNVFNAPGDYTGISMLLGAIFFSFQIYCDFSGYSDIAIGTARLFGFKAMRNFNFPYFSRDIAEFWRRWHISLTTWFRDYVYIPLGGSRGSTTKIFRNTIIIFLVSGFWHGANWTFIVWGGIHAAFFLPYIMLHKNRSYIDTVAKGKFLPSIKEIFQMFTTFLIVMISWIFFRAEDLTQAVDFIRKMLYLHGYSYIFNHRQLAIINLCLIIILLFIEWISREEQYGLEKQWQLLKRPYRWAIYFIIFMVILTFSGQQETFIYFQF